MSKRAGDDAIDVPAAKSTRLDHPSLVSQLTSKLLAEERVLFRILSFCISQDELASTSINVSVLGGTVVKVSENKWDLLRVCKAWKESILKWSTNELMVDLSFRRKLVRSQMKCENEKRWDVLSIGFFKSREGDAIKHLKNDPPATATDKEGDDVALKTVVPPLASNLPTDQLEKILQLPLLSRGISLSQITQIYIPFVNDDHIFQQLRSLPSLVKLFVFKYQMKSPLNVNNFVDLECPNLRRLRLSGLSLPSPSSSSSSPSPFAHLFQCLDSNRMGHLRHLQLELRLEEEDTKDKPQDKTKETKEITTAAAHLHSTSLQRLSLDNYYADYFFNVSLDCPNMTSVYLRCIKFTLGPAFDSFCKLASNRNVKLWLDYITIYTPNGHVVRFEETNLHLTADYKHETQKLVITRASLKKLLVNESTLTFDDKLNSTIIEIDKDGVWIEIDGRKTRLDRREIKTGDWKIEMEGENDGEKGRIVLLCNK